MFASLLHDAEASLSVLNKQVARCLVGYHRKGAWGVVEQEVQSDAQKFVRFRFLVAFALRRRAEVFRLMALIDFAFYSNDCSHSSIALASSSSSQVPPLCKIHFSLAALPQCSEDFVKSLWHYCI